MIVLGIESTAHTFGVGIVEEERILADQRVSLRPKEGGILPREAADLFSREGATVLRKALEEAGVGFYEIDGVAFSLGPGLGPSLRTGAVLARYLARRFGKPLVGVNHGVGHIEIGKITTGAKDPLVVYLSGANTQIIGYEKGKYRVFGETLDMGLGNMIDSFARELGIPFPGGPRIEELARRGNRLIDLPYTVKGSDLTFSGLLTAAIKALEKYDVEDVCFSLQEIAFAMVVEVTERALAHTGKEEVLLVGGVAANKRLQEMMRTMAEDRGAEVFIVPQRYAADNGVMIAWTGELYLKCGYTTPLQEPVNPRYRVDQAPVPWMEKECGGWDSNPRRH